MKLRYAVKTDVGLQREHNEDSYALIESDRVFIVADGMGGHLGGEVASNVAVDIVSDVLRDIGKTPDQADERLARAIKLANERIRLAADGSHTLRGMGTTIVAAVIEDGHAHIGHVGDSRAYRLRGGDLARLTKDHSLLQDFMDAMGGLSEEEQKSFPQRNVLTRAVGKADQLDVEVTRAELAAGDRLLLCTDGLYGMVDDRALRECLAEIADPDELVTMLIERANQAGGVDNITALVIDRLE